MGSLLPRFSEPTQAGTTPEVRFRAVVGAHGVAEMNVAL